MLNKPDYHQHEEFQNRTRKLNDIRELGIDPYPAKYTPKDKAKNLVEAFPFEKTGDSEAALAGTTPFACVAGRLVLFRSMGKNAFAHLQDETGRLQIMFNRDTTEVVGYPKKKEGETQELSPYKFIEKKLDLGDIVGVEGHLFHTQKGELTLFVKKLTLLSKTLLPLADKYGGLADKELRYRKRWLDLISHPEVAQVFKTRTRLVHEIRDFFHSHQFMEVETPILQSIYGGAEARPFKTELNALNQEMFLRISLEIPLKKLIIGGMDRIFEMGRVFRNEGIDRNHNPEFTLLEAYAAHWDYKDMMQFVENLFEKLALSLYGTTLVPHTTGENSDPIFIDMKAPWTRMSMKESILVYGQHDIDAMSDEEMRRLLRESGHIDPKKLKALNRGLMIAAFFEVFVEPHLIQPHHIYDHPVETTPLCKLHRDPLLRKEGIVERFESFILTQEICNAYTELNDPEFQRTLLEKQADRRDAGDEEASPLDEEFIEAICQGMPPTGGIGIGIDRLVMIMTNSHSIRDVLYFPWMKPQISDSE